MVCGRRLGARSVHRRTISSTFRHRYRPVSRRSGGSASGVGRLVLRQSGESETVSRRPSEHLCLPIHELHAQREERRLEFLLNERTADCWLFRRNGCVTLPLDRVGAMASGAVPFLAPEIVLLYKAKDSSASDERDFNRTFPRLARRARHWLRHALTVCHPGTLGSPSLAQIVWPNPVFERTGAVHSLRVSVAAGRLTRALGGNPSGVGIRKSRRSLVARNSPCRRTIIGIPFVDEVIQ